jgi:hypothetical protein
MTHDSPLLPTQSLNVVRALKETQTRYDVIKDCGWTMQS